MTERRTLTDRISNRIFGVPAIAQLWAKFSARSTSSLVDLSPEIPFAQLHKPLSLCRTALLTTAGIHLLEQPPFNMANPDGDATYRVIPADAALDAIRITHKYYDHRHADIDLNIVFPISRFRELAEQGVIGPLAPRHYGFMGHIDGPQVDVLVRHTAREVADQLNHDHVDFAFLTPA